MKKRSLFLGFITLIGSIECMYEIRGHIFDQQKGTITDPHGKVINLKAAKENFQEREAELRAIKTAQAQSANSPEEKEQIIHAAEERLGLTLGQQAEDWGSPINNNIGRDIDYFLEVAANAEETKNTTKDPFFCNIQ